MTKLEAIVYLYDADHAFLSRETGEELCHAFNLKPPSAQGVMVNTADPKGLSVDGRKNGEVVYGYDARRLADFIAAKLDPEFRNPCHGRGSGLRFAVGHIERTLGLKAREESK